MTEEMQAMNKVTVRTLLRDFKTLEFPVVVTRWGKPWCVITSIEDWMGSRERTNQ